MGCCGGRSGGRGRGGRSRLIKPKKKKGVAANLIKKQLKKQADKKDE
jgi:hypothetical protein